MKELLDKQWGHPNLTIRHMAKFAVAYLGVWPISLGLLWLLTEKIGLWYMASAVFAGGITAFLRFVLSARFAFARKETHCKE